MLSSRMKSKSETALGKIVESHWIHFEEQGRKFRLNIMHREYFVQGKWKQRREFVILIDETESNGLIITDFGPTCGHCGTSDYIKEDKTGEGFRQKHAGFTCTRCEASTLNEQQDINGSILN